MYVIEKKRANLHKSSLQLFSVFENNVQGVDNTGDPTKDRQEDVDEQVSATSSFEEHA